MKYSYTLLCLLLLANCLAACKTSMLIQSFSTQFGLMYFVRSVEFTGEDGRAELDFTYRENDTMLVTCNFTLESPSPDIYALQRAFFQVEGKTIVCDSLRLMFTTRSENTARYTSTLTKEKFRSLFTHNRAQFVVQGKLRQLVFEGRESFEKNAKAVRLDVLNLP
ncbi:MAG: hypothetical protein D0433_13475 [Candidatus Thermochlorobacter aerophilum]|jgi:hypothetical protein|uniref:LPS export ABC transporter periplasmic protein LptC n=1 Tax=Candidatus Thermochlorobacter aerophilus TaxID=1868324 RepID=A0A395LWN8_9BACT|nr:MAG: hypothetical protein D0433_13475 [Candidatus Thermochlorobacter aerophilum]